MSFCSHSCFIQVLKSCRSEPQTRGYSLRSEEMSYLETKESYLSFISVFLLFKLFLSNHNSFASSYFQKKGCVEISAFKIWNCFLFIFTHIYKLILFVEGDVTSLDSKIRIQICLYWESLSFVAETSLWTLLWKDLLRKSQGLLWPASTDLRQASYNLDFPIIKRMG